MPVSKDLAEPVRTALAGNGALREVRMFGRLCFMLNGNMVAGTSKRGLLVRIGKKPHAHAQSRPAVSAGHHLSSHGLSTISNAQVDRCWRCSCR